MLWSLLKIVVFLGDAPACSPSAPPGSLETPGEVKIAFGAREFFVSPIGFVVGLAVLVLSALVILKIVGFLGGAGALPARRRDRDQPLLQPLARAPRPRRAVRAACSRWPPATPTLAAQEGGQGGEAAATARR